MPFAQAMRRAKQELMEEDERRAMQVPKPTPLQQHDPSWRPEGLLLPIRTDYADAVRHNSIAGNQQPQEGPNRQVHDKATQEKVASSPKKPNEGLGWRKRNNNRSKENQERKEIGQNEQKNKDQYKVIPWKWGTIHPRVKTKNLMITCKKMIW
ncbi:hypothetical protein V1264_010860 [Littorina saxatilis]|uniref:Uncharacterized protein n=1 Tax=Littorina saxatilis TaxID=31220 RepID=A0AAN9BTW5_9CAEN